MKFFGKNFWRNRHGNTVESDLVIASNLAQATCVFLLNDEHWTDNNFTPEDDGGGPDVASRMD